MKLKSLESLPFDVQRQIVENYINKAKWQRHARELYVLSTIYDLKCRPNQIQVNGKMKHKLGRLLTDMRDDTYPTGDYNTRINGKVVDVLEYGTVLWKKRGGSARYYEMRYRQYSELNKARKVINQVWVISHVIPDEELNQDNPQYPRSSVEHFRLKDNNWVLHEVNTNMWN